jgi:hypothetical protein
MSCGAYYKALRATSPILRRRLPSVLEERVFVLLFLEAIRVDVVDRLRVAVPFP